MKEHFLNLDNKELAKELVDRLVKAEKQNEKLVEIVCNVLDASRNYKHCNDIEEMRDALRTCNFEAHQIDEVTGVYDD